MRIPSLGFLILSLNLACNEAPSSATPPNIGEARGALAKDQGGVNGDWDYCNSNDCVTGEGDCDGDGQCGGEAGLVCGDNNGARFGLTSSHDVCWPAHCQNGAQDGDEIGVDLGGSCDLCPGNNGDLSFCTAACACDAGEGDCDRDADCAAGNICGDNNGARFGFSASLDVCWPSTCEDGVKNGDETGIDFGGSCGGACFEAPPGSFSYCSNDCPCPAGGGDCDSDAQCIGALVCGNNNGWRFGFSSTIDTCWPSTCNNGILDKGEITIDLGGPCGSGPWLIINEFEYDDPSGDNMEFVEIYNAGNYTISLADVVLEAVDANGAVYQTYNLSDASSSLRAGEYLVIGADLIISTLPQGVYSITVGTYVFINTAGGFKLRQGEQLLDTVSYEGNIAGITETNPAPTDNGLTQVNARCVNGADSDDNSADFLIRAATPGAANSCP
ncbi:lamin tail domain-containing protein [Myxococcota bacterium]|nr:lamin tail domain-containing protein [Myxococcota bacterium]MBU1432787.1 lamin tail domain-containing protein [Myxococcota bacterium]MBU1897308.1 lamin tail domain-containing protein [Myxococcota bacterium]